jgi:hypothetical protein
LSALVLVTVAVGDLSAQAGRTERTGDFLMVGLPVATLGSTLMLDDHVGSRDFLFGFALNGAVTAGLKAIVHKDRPDGSDRKSFPSGHTSISFQSASFIHVRYGTAAAAFVGFSRVHARKHFVEDVVAGLALGIASARVFTERRPEDDPSPGGGLGAGLSLRFGGGLAPGLSFQLLEMPR